ncbi:Mitochondrial pyruvate carrier 4 [Stylosanthes scabra]|uniref:Mitochondrial pyruvate carrier n=1 Tax=Stylosanthes scabra TaxID=79078 RepID=A0ABU6ZAH5_9FABA|nr:Mitochondrial pyruvate carrier 4 [Stylosanthes scabra]
MAASKLQALWNHPAGPKTIHFWAPTFKWGISIANIADFAKPPEKISYPQQIGRDAYYNIIYCYILWTSPSTKHTYAACCMHVWIT